MTVQRSIRTAALGVLLAERYPHDRATGFAVGDLRGAFSVRQPID